MKTGNRIIMVFVASLLVICANGQKPGAKEKVKSLIVTEEKHDMLVNKQYKISETYYDTKGNVIEEINYKQGKIKKHFKYQYDSNENKIKEEELDPSGKILEWSEYKYENGLRTEKIVYDSNNKMKSRRIYKYTSY